MKRFIASATGVVVVGMSLVAVGGTAAVATENENEIVCVPQEGQEYIPPTYKTVDNPDYVPAVPDRTETETTDWVHEDDASEYEDWELIDTRVITDEEAIDPVIEIHRKYKKWVETTYKTIDNPDYVPAWTETIPAQGEPTIEVIDEEAWVEEIHHDAVYEDQVTKVEYRKWKIFWWDYKWFPVEAQPNKNSGWKKTGNEKVESVKVKDAWVEEIHHEATYKTIDNPDYVPEQTIEHEAIGEPTIEVVDVEGHFKFKWTVDKELPQPWELVKTKEKVIKEGSDAVTHEEYIFQRQILIPGAPAVGDPTIEIVVDEGQPAIEEVVCPPVTEDDEPELKPAAQKEEVVLEKASGLESPRLAETGADNTLALQVMGAAALIGLGILGTSYAIRKNN